MTGEEVTVVIPNYNGKQLLKNCIRTLERQTVRDFTLLVIDNGSTDGSTELSSDILSMEMVCLPENRGFCGAVNIGLAKAATPVVKQRHGGPGDVCGGDASGNQKARGRMFLQRMHD